MTTSFASDTAPRRIGQLLLLTGGLLLLLSTTSCVQQDQPLTPWQQQYYKHQQDYQTLGDNRRTNDHECRMKSCM